MLCVADVDAVAAPSAAERQTWRFGSRPDARVALTLAMWRYLWAEYWAVVAREGTVHPVPRLKNTSSNPLEKLLEPLVESNRGLLDILSGLVQCDVLVGLLAMRLEY